MLRRAQLPDRSAFVITENDKKHLTRSPLLNIEQLSSDQQHGSPGSAIR